MKRQSLSYQLLLVSGLLAPLPLAGVQQVDSLQVPMDLAMALLSGQGRETRISVGSAPTELEGAIPLGVAERVVGGLGWGGGGMVVLEMTGSAPQATSYYAEYLEGLGWTEPPRPAGERGGFQRSGQFGQDWWCGDGYSVQLTSVSFDSRTYLRVGYQKREVGRNACDPPDTGAMTRRDPYGGLELPTLEPPPGAEVLRGGGGVSVGGIVQEVTIASALGLEPIFEHYARQLAAAGWTLQGRATGEGVAMGRWSAQSEAGQAVVGTLSLSALRDDHSYRAWLRMDRADPRR